MVLVVVCVHCEARILKVWYGCAVPENTLVVDVNSEYSSGGLDRMTAKNKSKIPLCVPKLARLIRDEKVIINFTWPN